MTTVSLSEAKDRLSGLVDEAETTHEVITITKQGRAAAVLMAADDLDSLHETLYWLSQPEIRESLAEGEREFAAGETASGADLRAEFGLPAR
ncbi:MAG: antitoxin YefM [Pseudonocardiales bacterium]|jgi:prevent-host-death family protein|nr:antitoxin YefM [Pseudonocardiales bacterium]